MKARLLDKRRKVKEPVARVERKSKKIGSRVES